MFCIIVSISINDVFIDKSSLIVLLSTCLLGFITVISLFSSKVNEVSPRIPIFLLGSFIVSVIGYSIYQWQQLTEVETGSGCGIFLPYTQKYTEDGYHLYRVIYLTTLIVIVSLLQFKVDGSNFSLYGVKSYHLNYFLYLSPIILPLLTEMVDLLMNKVFYPDEQKSNPESLLANFVLGDSKIPEDEFNLRMIWPIIFYLILMFITVDSSYGITSFWGAKNGDSGNAAIKIAIFFVIFFPFIMRVIFIQDCSLDPSKNISDDDEGNTWDRALCAVEKYGGIQTMLCVSLLIILIYNINNPIYKLLFFLIICLASWGLSTTYMLTLVKP